MADAPSPPESLPDSLAEKLAKQDSTTLSETQDYIDKLLDHRRDPVTIEDIEPVDIGNSMFGPRTRIREIEKENRY
jgi:hypothetical protein